MHVMDVIRYDLDDFMILNIKGVDYRFLCATCVKIQQSNC